MLDEFSIRQLSTQGNIQVIIKNAKRKSDYCYIVIIIIYHIYWQEEYRRYRRYTKEFRFNIDPLLYNKVFMQSYYHWHDIRNDCSYIY